MAVDMEREAGALRRALADRGLTHLSVETRGMALTVLADADPDIRLRHVGDGTWQLDLHHHSRRWEETPFEGDLDEMVDMAESLGRLENDELPWAWRE